MCGVSFWKKHQYTLEGNFFSSPNFIPVVRSSNTNFRLFTNEITIFILKITYFSSSSSFYSLSLESIVDADIAAAVPLISMGALLGRTTPIQLLFMAIVEIVLFAANEYVALNIFSVSIRIYKNIKLLRKNIPLAKVRKRW